MMLTKIRSQILLPLFSLIILLISSCGTGTSSDGVTPEEESAAEAFSISLAVELGLLSLVAYEQRVECINSGSTAITVPDDYTLIEVFYETVDPDADATCKDKPTQIPIAFIATKDDVIYLVFRGTATASEEVLDADITQVKYTFVSNGGNTESGFTGLYAQFNDAFIAKINEMVATGTYTTLYVTGHSLGAALAVMAIPELANQSATINTIMYTFAGPGVGNTDFANLFNSSIVTSYRVVNTNDVIPKLPPIELTICPQLFYKHVNTEVTITFGTEISGFPSFDDDKCSVFLIEAALGIFLDTNKDAVEENHSLCTYYDTYCDMTDDPQTCKDDGVTFGKCPS